MLKKILFVSVFGLDGIESNSRLKSVYDFVSGDKLVVTTDFNHRLKKHFKSKRDGCIHLHVLPYKSNVSFMRILSHIMFAYKLWKYLNNIKERPDCIYCAMPTSTAAYVCGRFCKNNKIHFVIDVIDLWPDSFLSLLGHKRNFIKWFLYPWRLLTTQAYKFADVIIGESKEYAAVAHGFNTVAPVYSFYIGIDMDKITRQISNSQLLLDKCEDEIWIAYAGSMGVSYDFKTLIEGVACLNNKYKYKLFFIGDGTERENVDKLIRKHNVNAYITGFVDYGDLLKYLSYCDIAVNIFRENTRVVHSYKFNDYVATKCFILNSLIGETADIISSYKIGLNFTFERDSFVMTLLKVVGNWGYYKYWRENNNRLIDEILDKKIVYGQLNEIFSKE